MNRIYFFIFVYALMLSLTACKKDNTDTGWGSPEPTGIITGKVVTPNNRKPVRQALVYISTNKNLYSTYTDNQGNFSLTAAAGTHDMYVQTGKGDKFRSVVSVDVIADQTTAMSDIIRLNLVGNFAYVAGSYDKIEAILRDSMGYNAGSLNYIDLMSVNQLAAYDAIFINCGAYNAAVSNLTDTALSLYVAGGGSLYASDYSMNYLTGQYASATACQVPRTWGFINDATVCSRRLGTISVIPQANIVSTQLQNYLGKNTMNISYNLGQWERIQQIDNNFWETMVTDPTDNSPLLIRTHQFNTNNLPSRIGSRDTTHVTICHQVPNSNPITITVNANAVAAHLAHGDALGMCNNPSNNGWVYFTTFHNEHNGMISEDVKHILEFMILNL
jgi:hypothetical protein